MVRVDVQRHDCQGVVEHPLGGREVDAFRYGEARGGVSEFVWGEAGRPRPRLLRGRRARRRRAAVAQHLAFRGSENQIVAAAPVRGSMTIWVVGAGERGQGPEIRAGG